MAALRGGHATRYSGCAALAQRDRLCDRNVGTLRQQRPAASQNRKASWLRTHGRDLRFLGLFALYLAIFYAFSQVSFARDRLFPGYLRLNTLGAKGILNVFGEGVEARGNSLVSARFQVSIERGCDAVEPSALFCAAVLASPVAWSSRLLAVVVGTTILMVVNFIRVLSLYYTGAYFRRAFDIMHLDVWQVLFIMLAILLWALWASRQKQGLKGRGE
jgi:exosortase/archaeosortase family protein